MIQIGFGIWLGGVLLFGSYLLGDWLYRRWG